MNRIDELIKKLCPNGVEYKKASEIKIESFWLMPSTPTYIADGVPYITSKNIKNGKINFENVNYISEKDYLSISSNRTIKKNDLLITMIGTIGETAFVEEDIKFYGQNMYLIRLNEKVINRKFFNYYLTSEKIKNSLVSRKNTSSQGYIKAGSIENLLLPVPPLEVQCEIVHILDNFTLLSAELSAELKARQKQFTYFEEKLLFNNNFEKVKLADLCIVNQGLQIPINQRKKEPAENRYFYITVQFLKGGDEKYYIESPQPNVICKKEDILVTRTGSTGKIITGVEGCFHNNFFKVEPNERILKRYLYFVLNSKRMYNKMLRAASGGTVPDLPHRKFYNLEIFLPSIEEQEKIINILDSFEKLCNDISEGLPAEIEARQKQYEYYRDKLLTFKELKVNE